MKRQLSVIPKKPSEGGEVQKTNPCGAYVPASGGTDAPPAFILEACRPKVSLMSRKSLGLATLDRSATVMGVRAGRLSPLPGFGVIHHALEIDHDHGFVANDPGVVPRSSKTTSPAFVSLSVPSSALMAPEGLG